MKTSTEVCRLLNCDSSSLSFAIRRKNLTCMAERGPGGERLFSDDEVERYVAYRRGRDAEILARKEAKAARRRKQGHTLTEWEIAERLAIRDAAERVLIEKLKREREQVNARRMAWQKAREKTMRAEGRA